MKILIADDNVDFSSTLKEIVNAIGYTADTFNTPNDTILHLKKYHNSIDLLLLDIEFGPGEEMSGLDILEFSKKHYPSIPVIMISGKGSIETAVNATKLGALNFIEKSLVSKEKIKSVLDSASLKMGIAGEEKDIIAFLSSNGIYGKSKALLEVGDKIVRFGRTDLNVMITGETGTGKKLVAKAIHNASRRYKQSFVTVDIPNIPKELFQSELFGHVKGAFSGASDTKKGLFHHADKGTVFLDEIGDMAIELQANLLIPIEEKVVRKLGSVEPEHVDLRFVSATDKDLPKAMMEGKFREQLYHRLRECEIYLPPLRQRVGDIHIIAEQYLAEHNAKYEDSKILSTSAIDFLVNQQWHGNIRELSSLLRVVLQTTMNKQIDSADIVKNLNTNQIQQQEKVFTITDLGTNKTLKEDVQEVDKKIIEQTLADANGNVSKSAAKLGVSRETLHNKIRRYNIDITIYRKK